MNNLCVLRGPLCLCVLVLVTKNTKKTQRTLRILIELKMRFTKPFLLSFLVLFFCWQYSSAKIVRIEITGTEVYDGAKKFGDAGEYIKISGWAYGEVDPKNSLNSIIQDIQLAPRNVRGKVEYVNSVYFAAANEYGQVQWGFISKSSQSW